MLMFQKYFADDCAAYWLCINREERYESKRLR